MISGCSTRLAGSAPWGKPAHTSTLIGDTTKRDTISGQCSKVIPAESPE